MKSIDSEYENSELEINNDDTDFEDKNEDDNTSQIEPFDPLKISITKKSIPLDVITRRLKQGTIILAPIFQRNAVWNGTQKSRLIESLMLNIPIPMFYVASDENGKWDVIDGLQRLTAIKEFVLDEKKQVLKNLEFWKKYEGITIDDLPGIIYNRIFETEFTFAIVEPNMPEKAKYNIFKRINTGGTPLNSQEIRNALYNGMGTKFIKELANSEQFKSATNNSVSDTRMIAQECVLRFISFLLVGRDGYKSSDSLDDFLNRNLRILNDFDKVKNKIFNRSTNDLKDIDILVPNLEELKNLFYKGLNRSYDIFGEKAFRLMSKDGSKKTPVNRSLLETFGSLFARLTNREFDLLLERKTLFLERYENIRTSNDFSKAITRVSWTKNSVDYRFNTISDLISEVIR